MKIIILFIIPLVVFGCNRRNNFDKVKNIRSMNLLSKYPCQKEVVMRGGYYLVFTDNTAYNVIVNKNKISIIDNYKKCINNNLHDDIILSVNITKNTGFNHAKYYCIKGLVIAEFILSDNESLIYSKNDQSSLKFFYKSKILSKIENNIYCVK